MSSFFLFTASRYIFFYNYTYFSIKSLLALKIIQYIELYKKVFWRIFIISYSIFKVSNKLSFFIYLNILKKLTAVYDIIILKTKLNPYIWYNMIWIIYLQTNGLVWKKNPNFYQSNVVQWISDFTQTNLHNIDHTFSTNKPSHICI